MTAIVGIAFRGRVYLGGDSMISDEFASTTLGEAKIWRSGGVIFGCAGDLYALQHLKHATDWPRFQRQKREQFLARKLGPTLRQSLKALWDGMATKSDADPPDVDLLVGLGGHLYGVDGSGAYHDTGGAWAVGIGSEAARGALHGSSGDPEDRIMAALEAAAAVCPSVAGPFDVMSQG